MTNTFTLFTKENFMQPQSDIFQSLKCHRLSFYIKGQLVLSSKRIHVCKGVEKQAFSDLECSNILDGHLRIKQFYVHNWMIFLVAVPIYIPANSA